MFKAKDLKYTLLPGRVSQLGDSSARIARLHAEAFRLWNEVWAETFRELDGNGRVFSDDFSRQDQIGCLFWQSRCIALGLFHSVDFRLPTARLDSYFKVWTDEAIQKLLEDGPRILVGSNITVDSAFRGKLDDGTHLKNLLVGLMARTFLDSGQDAMAGTMRCNRGMHHATYDFGAVPLQSNVIHHGVEVDLISFYRRRLLEGGMPRTDLNVESLWTRRLDLTAGFEESETIPMKTRLNQARTHQSRKER